MASLRTASNFIGRTAWGEVGAQGEMGSQPHLTLRSNLAPCCALYEAVWKSGDDSGGIRFLETSILFL